MSMTCYGHKAGDEVLSAVAARIKKSLRQGRILPGAMAAKSLSSWWRVQLQINVSTSPSGYARQLPACPFRLSRLVVKVTISLGLAWMIPDPALTLDILINNADQAMYKAKQQGRDRVVVWTPDEQPIDSEPTDQPFINLSTRYIWWQRVY